MRSITTDLPTRNNKFTHWLKTALYCHRAWLAINLTALTVTTVLDIMEQRKTYDICSPSVIGSGLDYLIILIMFLIWIGNTVALLVGLLRWRDNSTEKRLTLIGLWLITPFCWVWFGRVAFMIAGPDCSQF